VTVPANKAQPLPMIQPEAYTFKQRMATKTFCKVFYINHE